MDTVGLRVPANQFVAFPPLTSATSQDLAIQQGASRLQTSANLRTFTINMTSPLKIHFPLLNPTELRHYRVTCIFYCLRLIFSLILVLDLV
jgi:hypothetical protein